MTTASIADTTDKRTLTRFVRDGADVLDVDKERMACFVDDKQAREAVDWLNSGRAEIEDYVWELDEAGREVQEINALNMQLAFDRARLDAAVERLLDTDADTLTVPTCYVEAHPKPLTGSKVHVVHEEWADGRLRPRDIVHAVEDCNGYWCHEDRQPRRFQSADEISFAFRGEWVLVAYSGDNAILLSGEAAR